MKMKLRERVETEVEIDVEFPIYRRHDLDSDYNSNTLFMRVDQVKSKLWEWRVHIHDRGEVEIGVNKDYRFGRSGSDYLLGRGMYESNKQEFMEALREAEELLKTTMEFVEREQT